MSLIRAFVLLLGLALVSTSVSAQTASARGMGSASYGFRLSADTRAEALHKAKVNALEAHVAESGAARVRLFEQHRSQLLAEVDRYVLSAVVLNEQEDRKAKTFTVFVRAEINTTLLQARLDANAAVVAGAPGEQAMLTFVFMARSQDSVQSFDDRVYQRADASAAYRENTREGESFRGNSIGTSGSIDQSVSVTTTTGGSTTRRSDAVTWKVANASDVNTVMTGAFSAAGYEVIEAEYVEGINIERVRSDFGTGNDLAPATLRDTASGANAAGIRYVAVGTLDVGMRDRDPVTGNTRIHVTVTGKLLDVSGRFPRTISSVGPMQYAGLGADESVARVNALREAASQAAQQMVNEMNLKSVR